MIFGSKSIYLYGEVFKDKFVIPGQAFKIEPMKFDCKMCPAKLVGGKIEIFFNSPIFNTYVLSSEEQVCTLFSLDEKLTIMKRKLQNNTLYTVKTVKEDANMREVEIYNFDESTFPGYRTSGTVQIRNNEPYILTSGSSICNSTNQEKNSSDRDMIEFPLRGRIALQSNEARETVECLLYKIEDETI